MNVAVASNQKYILIANTEFQADGFFIGYEAYCWTTITFSHFISVSLSILNFFCSDEVNLWFIYFWWLKQFWGFTECNTAVGNCSSFPVNYATSSAILSVPTLIRQYTSSMQFACDTTGYNEKHFTSASDYLFVPKGSMAFIGNDFNIIMLAAEVNMESPDYYVSIGPPYRLSNMSSPNIYQLYFSVNASYLCEHFVTSNRIFVGFVNNLGPTHTCSKNRHNLFALWLDSLVHDIQFSIF